MCFGIGMTLREGNREYFYEKLDIHFPGLRAEYEKRYGNNYIVTSRNNSELMPIFQKTCAENNIVWGNDKLFAYMSAMDEKTGGKQMELFQPI